MRRTVSISVMLACLFGTLPSASAAEEPVVWIRNDDPVVVTGSTLPDLLGTPLTNLTVLRCDGSAFTPVPFQIDEKLPAGTYAFTHGVQAARDPDPTFDANDELVFLAADGGAPCPAALPPGTLRSARIDARDRAGASRSAYLVAFAGLAPRSPIDYIRGIQDVKRKVWRVEAKTYRIELVDNASRYDYLSVKGRNGIWTENLIDRLKIRGEARMFWGALRIPILADEVYRLRFDAWIDGPVRIIALGHGYLDAFKNVLKIPLKGSSLVHLYPTYFVFPITGYLPINPASVLTSLRIHGVNEFNRKVYGHNLRYYDAHVPYQPGVTLDGKTSAAEQAMNVSADRDWLVLIGDNEATLCRVVFPKDWTFAAKELYYKEDPSRSDPPEAEKGILAVGFDVGGLVELKRGWVTLVLQYYFPETFAAGEEKRILDIQDDPLAVTVEGVP